MSGSKDESRNPGYTGQDDRPVQRKVERMREWQHGEVPEGRTCHRKDKPVFTRPDQLPQPCGNTRDGYDFNGCGGESWRSKGVVYRDQEKRIVRREP